MRLQVDLTISNKLPAVAELTAIGLQRLMAQVGNRAVQYAKRNVSPDHGPGPHPHVSEHTDTGWLMDHVFSRRVQRGFFLATTVYTDVEYGAHLEIGWYTVGASMWLSTIGRGPKATTIATAKRNHHARTGITFARRFHRYPWLSIAFKEAQADFKRLAAPTIREALLGTATGTDKQTVNNVQGRKVVMNEAQIRDRIRSAFEKGLAKGQE